MWIKTKVHKTISILIYLLNNTSKRWKSQSLSSVADKSGRETRHNWFSEHQTIWITVSSVFMTRRQNILLHNASCSTEPTKFSNDVLDYYVPGPYIVISYPIFDRFVYVQLWFCNVLASVNLRYTYNERGWARSLPLL